MIFADRLKKFFGFAAVDENLYDDLVDLLIEGDIGASLAMKTVDQLKENCRKGGITDSVHVRAELTRLLSEWASEICIEPVADELTVILLLGVNGVGKTTSVAKLCSLFRDRKLTTNPILAAGDTFRAAAVDQLKIHGERLGVRVVAQEQGSDAGAVLYDALVAAKASGSNLIIADTAGRMHTKQNLLRELEKIDKIVTARVHPARYKKLLVVDATTGQNALKQAESFGEAVKLDGLIVTKYDSTAKGGLILSISQALGIPTAFIGYGEKYSDIKVFKTADFLRDFLGSDES